MNMRKQSAIFFLTFMILVINEQFANAFLEYYYRPSALAKSWANVMEILKETGEGVVWLATGDDSYLPEEPAKPDNEYLIEPHDAIKITMQLFTTVSGIVHEHLGKLPKVKPEDEIYKQLWQINLCIKEEVQAINGKLNDSSDPVDNTYRLKKTATLSAVIFTKFLAYNRANRFSTASPPRGPQEVQLQFTRQKAKVLWYLLKYACRINTESIFDTIDRLVAGTCSDVSPDGYCEQAKSKFNEIKLSVSTLDDIFKNVISTITKFLAKNPSILNKDTGVNDLLIGFSNAPSIAFAQMLYKLDTIDLKATKKAWFNLRVTAAFTKIYKEIDKYVDMMENSDHVDEIIPMILLARMEIVIGEIFGLYGKIATEEKNQINKGTGSTLFMDYMAEKKLVAFNSGSK